MFTSGTCRTAAQIVGHRGSGSNSTHPACPENSLDAVAKAVKDGADFVEFDVQLTSDKIPVLHHDWLVGDCDYVANLTLAEFLTRNSDFCSLESLLGTAPLSLGLNIEVKYPMYFEVDGLPRPQRWLSPNEYVSSIVRIVNRYRENRQIVFSSFHPDVCIALSALKLDYPVLLLTVADAGQSNSEIDATLGHAVSFAKGHGLQGIVSESAALKAELEMISTIKREGLWLWTYGHHNNDPAWARAQSDLGVDAIITDKVSDVYSALKENARKTAS